MLMASEESPGVRSSGFTRQDSSSTSLSLGFDPYQAGLNLQFVEPLEDRYKCVTCSFVLCNPYQTGCGHRFCENCIAELTDSKPIAICPIDHEKIIANWIFRDNCCKREVWNLMVYCKNAPDCNVKVSLGRLGDHLKKCQFETVACINGCDAILQRKELTGHLQTVCEYREEACQYCKVNLIFKNMKEHEDIVCPKYPIQCTYDCGECLSRNEKTQQQTLAPRHIINCKDGSLWFDVLLPQLRGNLYAHLTNCPEAEVECSYKKYGCHVREKRRNIQEHEHSALNEHLLLVVTNNNKLEEQILDLKKTFCERNQVISQLEGQINNLDIEIRQLSEHISKNDDEVAKTQKMLAGHTDKIITIEQQSQQLSRRLDQEGNNEISALKEIINILKEKVEGAENNIASLVTFQPCLKQHESLLNAHKELLEKTNERFRVLEATSYNGKLIWKICDYRKRKQEAAEGRTPSLFSQPFYTSRCGYRLCARAYLNGDGAGKGTHLSLFFVVMKGEYDSLLLWPFRQKVTLTLLDQSPKKHHIVELFKADAGSTSFKRPVSEMNIASGCPRFVPHTVLEGGKTATFIKDDTLFIKVIVDLSDLEDL